MIPRERRNENVRQHLRKEYMKDAQKWRKGMENDAIKRPRFKATGLV